MTRYQTPNTVEFHPTYFTTPHYTPQPTTHVEFHNVHQVSDPYVQVRSIVMLTNTFVCFQLYFQTQQFTYSSQQRLPQVGATSRSEIFHHALPQQTIHALARGELSEGFVPRQDELLTAEGISQEQAAEMLSSPIQIIHQGSLSLEDISHPQQNSSSTPSYITTAEVVTIKKGKKLARFSRSMSSRKSL